METDLEVSKIDLYLLGICSFLDAVTSIKQSERERERERGMPSLPYLWPTAKISFCNREVGEIEWEGFFFFPNNVVLFF